MSEPDETPERPAILITGGNPTTAEIAAATAVLHAALDELAGIHRLAQRSPSAWERGRRGLRQPLAPGGWNSWGS